MKKVVRNTLKALRNAIASDNRSELSREACEMIAALPEYACAKQLLLYHPFGSELDVSFLAQKAFADEKSVALPYLTEDGMRFLNVDSFETLPTMTYDIPPEFRASLSEPQNLSESLCVVPALALDIMGRRIGYGKGCYDRFLSSYTGVTVCSVFPQLFVSKLPTEPHDVSVDIAVIPRVGIKRFQKQKPPEGGICR